ncbi:MAG TPA: hypothetical protein VHT96_08810 [Clostridia bacterium]|nr:hypothetical protein [Clostridia bacterium]
MILSYTDDFYINRVYACYRGNAYRIYRKLDDKFRSIALSYDRCEELSIPAMIDEDVLVKCGYFESFPGQICAVTRFNPEDYESVTNHAERSCGCMVHDKQYLTPSACLHIYPLLSGCQIDDRVFTTRARVYRYEDKEARGLTRMWDFSVREIVFAGTREFVIRSLQDAQDRSLKIAGAICAQATLKKANDPFYDNASNRVKIRLQNRNSSKMELCIPIDGQEVAVSSFNYHGFHFSEPFGFSDNRRIVSGCVGYGLDRWLAAYHKYDEGEGVLENTLFG